VFSLLENSRDGHEWRFRILDVPVRVQAWFWLTVGLTAAARQACDALIWIGVCFVSILAHELGHVVAFRLFGVRAAAMLYGWGGLAVPEEGWKLNVRALGIVSLAGPAAGFGLAALVATVAKMAGAKFSLGVTFYMIPSVSAFLGPSLPCPQYLSVLLNDLLYVNLYWGLVNLLPVYPLDGGQVVRAMLEEADPIRGLRRTLLVSAVVGAVVASVGVWEKNTYLIFLFGCLAVTGATELLAPKPVFRNPCISSRDECH
jgi:stage IV sporulation protein FB